MEVSLILIMLSCWKAILKTEACGHWRVKLVFSLTLEMNHSTGYKALVDRNVCQKVTNKRETWI